MVLAWTWFDLAIIAANTLEAGASETDGNFYLGKIQACRSFYYWELPKVPAWLQLLDPVDRTCLEMKDEWF